MRYLLFTCIIITTIISSCSFNNTKQRGDKYGGTLKINLSDVPDIIFPG
ncbi:MAG: hypothetical protein JEZ09_14690, partial [Salinivirgaceae bacterium]|nr:hypothetical protein [Salinivirgaceae bacterium]